MKKILHDKYGLNVKKNCALQRVRSMKYTRLSVANDFVVVTEPRNSMWSDFSNMLYIQVRI